MPSTHILGDHQWRRFVIIRGHALGQSHETLAIAPAMLFDAALRRGTDLLGPLKEQAELHVRRVREHVDGDRSPEPEGRAAAVRTAEEFDVGRQASALHDVVMPQGVAVRVARDKDDALHCGVRSVGTALGTAALEGAPPLGAASEGTPSQWAALDGSRSTAEHEAS